MARATALPASDRLVTLRDGRSLAYAEWGDPDGRPVILFHGGRSDPQPDRSYLTWADDYAELHGVLGLPQCPIVGWSAGGPYALACAVQTPALVSSVGLAASVAPLDNVPGARDELPAEVRSVVELLRHDRVAAVEKMTRQSQWYADDPASIFERFGHPDDADHALLARPDVREAMTQYYREGARQGAAGFATDAIVFFDPWGFSVADVTLDVGVWLGERDTDVRPDADYLVATIRRATLVIYPADRHWVPLSRWTEMLAWLR